MRHSDGNQKNANTFSIVFPQNSQTKILAFGDWSKSEDGIRSFDLMKKLIPINKYDAVIGLGDYAYDLASTSQEWDSGNVFLDWIQPVTSLTPFMLSAGNHEFIGEIFLNLLTAF